MEWGWEGGDEVIVVADLTGMEHFGSGRDYQDLGIHSSRVCKPLGNFEEGNINQYIF